MNEELFNKISRGLELQSNEMVHTLGKFIAIPAISPFNGGKGELNKIECLIKIVKKLGIDKYAKLEKYYTNDGKAIRPNIVLRIAGKNQKSGTKWVLAHSDIVSPGDLKEWKSNPYKLKIKRNNLIGRGVEDNGQAIAGMIYAIKCMKDFGIIPERNIALAIVADEETGSKYGLSYLIKKRLFKKGDEFLVPDGGSKKGDEIEIAEKTILWMKVTFEGLQAHGAASPNKSINATKMADDFGYTLIKELSKEFKEKDKLFTVPNSTFQPTRVYPSPADATNIIPDKNIREYDFRILPNIDIKKVLKIIYNLRKTIIMKYTNRNLGKKGIPSITIELTQKLKAAKPTSPDSTLIKELKTIISKVYNVKPKTVGIGGGTFAGILRQFGYNAAVWSTHYGNAHSYNETASKKNMVNDVKVFAYWLST